MRVTNVRFALTVGAAALAFSLACGLAAADPAGTSQGGFTNPASPVAHKINDLFWITTYLALAVGALVEGLLLFSLRKFRADRPGADEKEAAHDEDDDGDHAGIDPRLIRKEHGSAKIELMIFAVTAAVFGILVLISLGTLFEIETIPADPNALTVEVTGSQWAWQFHYPAQNVTELSALSEMHVPVNTNVRLNITATDVLHAVWIPDLGVKLDAVPGHVNHFWFNAEREGHYLLQCAEFCGGAHSVMHATVIVESAAAFQAWVDAKHAPPPTPPLGNGDRVNITLTEYHIAFDRTLTVDEGANITLNITNAGTMSHQFTLDAPYNWTAPAIAPGTSAEFHVVFDQIVANAAAFCPIANHRALGMNETFNVSAASRIVDVYLFDPGVPGGTFRIEPATIKATPGELVKFRVHNNGSMPHNLRAGDSAFMIPETATIGPGETTLSAPFPVQKSVKYWCNVPGHQQLGMEGTLDAGGAVAETGPTVPGFEAGWVLPALGVTAVAILYRRREE